MFVQVFQVDNWSLTTNLLGDYKHVGIKPHGDGIQKITCFCRRDSVSSSNTAESSKERCGVGGEERSIGWVQM